MYHSVSPLPAPSGALRLHRSTAAFQCAKSRQPALHYCGSSQSEVRRGHGVGVGVVGVVGTVGAEGRVGRGIGGGGYVGRSHGVVDGVGVVAGGVGADGQGSRHGRGQDAGRADAQAGEEDDL